MTRSLREYGGGEQGRDHHQLTPSRSATARISIIFPAVVKKRIHHDVGCKHCNTPLEFIQYGFSGEVDENGRRVFAANVSVDARVPRCRGGSYDGDDIDIVSTGTWHGVVHQHKLTHTRSFLPPSQVCCGCNQVKSGYPLANALVLNARLAAATFFVDHNTGFLHVW